jgi:hypothetical protein
MLTETTFRKSQVLSLRATPVLYAHQDQLESRYPIRFPQALLRPAQSGSLALCSLHGSISPSRFANRLAGAAVLSLTGILMVYIRYTF